ncbi:glycoside hydrolase superfamily [Fennellomyces sp. T-0311]|nr:glycoside hydrolase superfamily [Fennellomyces sp. T-0311]
MKFTSLSLACSLILAATTAQAKTWLLPIPQELEWTGHAATLSRRFTIRGAQNHYVRSAAKRYSDLIHKERWVPVQPAYEEETLEPSGSGLSSLDISVQDNSAKLDFGIDESYTLEIPADGGKATLNAATWVGALRGLETFSQLVVEEDGKLVAHTVSIKDSPSYPHRGMMLDSSRNFLPVKDILRTLDAMSYNKLNVLHWHATDAQSWPLVSESHPELTNKGAYSAKDIYTPRDVQRIIKYAESLGIRTILEIDMPAHTGIIAEAYPDYIIGYEEFWAAYAAEPPSGQIDLLNDDAWQLVKDIVKEGTEAFPDSFYHTGGDEISAACYELDENIVNYTKEHNMTTHELWFQWTNDLVKYVSEDLNKRPIVWEDPIRDGGSLPKNVVVQVWIAPPENYTSLGHDVIISTADYFYLDCGNGGWVGDDPRYISPTQQPTPEDTFNYGGIGGSWCAPYKTWQRIYSFDMEYGIAADSPGKVLGGEVPLWAEQVGPTVLDMKLWPRGGAAAELWWSGSYDKEGNRRTARNLLPRISDWNYRLIARGIAAQPLQPLWCVKHPERCNLNDPSES